MPLIWIHSSFSLFLKTLSPLSSLLPPISSLLHLSSGISSSLLFPPLSFIMTITLNNAWQEVAAWQDVAPGCRFLSLKTVPCSSESQWSWTMTAKVFFFCSLLHFTFCKFVCLFICLFVGVNLSFVYNCCVVFSLNILCKWTV